VKVWLIQTGETLPIDKKPRLLRTGILASLLTENEKNEVIWWTSDHNHFEGKLRFGENKKIELGPNYSLKLLAGRNYTKKISLSRFLNHKDVTKNFLKELSLLTKDDLPDVAVVSMPDLEIAEQAILYCKKNNIPVVVDLRDMWPDIWCDRLFPFFPSIGKVVFRSQFMKIRSICKNADAIFGISEGFLAIRPQPTSTKPSILFSLIHLVLILIKHIPLSMNL